MLSNFCVFLVLLAGLIQVISGHWIGGFGPRVAIGGGYGYGYGGYGGFGGVGGFGGFGGFYRPPPPLFFPPPPPPFFG